MRPLATRLEPIAGRSSPFASLALSLALEQCRRVKEVVEQSWLDSGFESMEAAAAMALGEAGTALAT